MLRPFFTLLILSLGANATSPSQEYSNTASIAGDFRVVRQDLAALVLEVPAGETARQVVALAGNSPVLYARYNPGQAVGRMEVVRVERRPDGSAAVVVTTVRPSDGARLAAGNGVIRRFGGVNPYVSFVSASPALGDYWVSANFNGFLAAAGMAMKQYGASVGFLSYPDIRTRRTETMNVNSGAYNPLDHQYQTSGAQYMRLRWLAAVPVENAGRDALIAAYSVPGCSPGASPRDNCIARSGVAWVAFDGGNATSSDVQVRSDTYAARVDGFRGMLLFTAISAYVGGDLYRTGGWDAYTRGTTNSASDITNMVDRGYYATRDGTLSGTAAADASTTAVTDTGVLATWNPGGVFDPIADVTAVLITPAAGSAAGGAATLYNNTRLQTQDQRAFSSGQMVRSQGSGNVSRSGSVNTITTR